MVAYYCRWYVLEQLMSLRRQGQKDEASEGILFALMDKLEQGKQEHGFGNRADAERFDKERAEVTNFALGVFKKADDADRAGLGNKATAMQFFCSAKFLDVLEVLADEGRGAGLRREGEGVGNWVPQNGCQSGWSSGAR